MPAFSCSNCRFRFHADAASKCPRCDSQDITEFKSGHAHQTTTHAHPSTSTPVARTGPRVLGEGKAAWQAFHNQQASTCPECGGTDFDLNYKRKEKTCKKCGAVMPLPRRFA